MTKMATSRYLAIVPILVACANVTVPDTDLPALPASSPLGMTMLALDDVPTPMAEEMRSFAGSAGSDANLGTDAALASACTSGSSFVLRPKHERTHFASNAPDRNTLFLYETLVIVGIPVTLVSAVAWKYFAETVVSGELEVLSCGDAETRSYVESFRLRSEGRGFVRTAPLKEAQLEGALRGLTRELLEQAADDFTRRRPE